ncbi:hypothetical protein [Schumannella luteola]
MSGLVRALLIAAIVIVHAVVQALTVVGDPVPIASWGFAASVLLSVAALSVAGWAVVTLVWHARWRWQGLAWMLGTVILATALSILSPVLPPLAILVGLIVVPAVVAGGSPLDGFRTLRYHPVRHAFGLLGVLALVVVGWAAALVLGLFVTGFAAAVATWLVFGAFGALVLAGWRERPKHPVGSPRSAR